MDIIYTMQKIKILPQRKRTASPLQRLNQLMVLRK